MGYFLLFIFIVFSIVAIIVVGIFQKTKAEGVPYKVGKSFLKQYNPKIGEDVNFWHNERTDEINIYLKGTGGGQGKIGSFTSKPDLKKIDNDELNAYIHNITEDTIYLKYY